MNDGVKDPFYDQVACARYRAERDMLAQAMDRVADDIEQTFLGFEGAEDAPAMRWARQFRAALGSLHAPVRDATTSACDLTPDEDREAAAWVREHGGLDVVKTRLMPEGMEWPRYDTGELVLIGDDVTGPDYGERIHVDEITFHANGFTLREKTGLDHWYESDDRFERSAVLAADGVCCEPGTYRCQERAFTCDSCGHTVFVDKCMVDEIRYLRAKGIRTLNCCCGHGGKVEPFIIVNEGDECRMLDMGYERRVNEHGVTYFTPKSSCPPKVIAADGEPLEAGQTVWHVSNGIEFTVIRLPKPGEYQAVEVRYRNGSSTSFDPDQLTHERPVLDADGVPIREGDTVWFVGGGEPAEVAYTIEADASHPDEVVLKGYEDDWPVNADKLTHTKPEPPDSWERIEEDKGLNPFDYCKKVGHKLWTFDNAEEVKASDLVRRCKALAERGE